jgi:hypothetical protein
MNMSGSINSITGSNGVSAANGAAPAVADSTSGSDPTALPPPNAQLVPVGDLGAQLAALLVNSGQDARKTDQQARAADEKAEDDAEQAQVASLRQKASDIQSDGLVDGLTTIGAGALQLGASVNSAQSSAQPPGSQARADLASKGAALSFDSTLLKGEGGIVGTSFKAAQANDDANATAHEADASHAKRSADDQDEDMKNDTAFINSAVDFYKQYAETKAQEKAAVTHGA